MVAFYNIKSVLSTKIKHKFFFFSRQNASKVIKKYLFAYSRIVKNRRKIMKKDKTVALIKQINGGFSTVEIRGVARLFEKFGKAVLSLSLVNLEGLKNGNYHLVFGKNEFLLENLDGGEFLLNEVGGNDLYLVATGEERVLVAHGSFSSNIKSKEEILQDAEKLFKKDNGEVEKEDIFQAQEYDDEAVATVNYYEFDQDKGIENYDGEGTENCQSAKGDEPFKRGEDLEEKKNVNGKTDAYENGYSNEKQAENRPIGSYYSKIKEEIDKIFKDYPEEKGLAYMVSESRWAKVGKGEKSYVVGLIFENSEPRYVCYGLAGSYYQKPTAIKGYCSFIPISPFDLKGEGYWVMYQDAFDGKRVE